MLLTFSKTIKTSHVKSADKKEIVWELACGENCRILLLSDKDSSVQVCSVQKEEMNNEIIKTVKKNSTYLKLFQIKFRKYFWKKIALFHSGLRTSIKYS